MHKKIYSIILIFTVSYSFSQTPEDALKLSWIHLNGTARNQAIGGAMGSLGGDASAGQMNPAGLAFFKTSDFVLTPGFQFGKGKSNFRGTANTGESVKNGGLGTTGFIFGGFGNRARNTFGLTINRLADFNQTTHYKGQNDYSSYGEPLADEFASSGLTIDQALLYSSNISLQTKMALYTYVVDTLRVNGILKVVALSENPTIRNQESLTESKGGITELNFGWGTEINKKWMAGISFGVSLINHERKTYYHESDASGNTNNNFSFLTYDEFFTQKGFGLNLRGGLIYRPKEYIRLGLAVHSPTTMYLKEETTAGFAADLENRFGAGNGYDSVSYSVLTGGSKPAFKYAFNSPTKIILSGSYVFREVEDIRRQKGFVTADIEYTNYKWMYYGPSSGEINADTKVPYVPFNQAIDAFYKSAFNFRVGGELKFKTVMTRLGFAYYGNPYKDNSELKARKMFLSGGLGYRNKGIFVDLTYVHRLNKDVNFPYRVNAPRANTFATLKDGGGKLLLTLGFKI